MRLARLLCVLALLTFLPTTIAAAPRTPTPARRFERAVRLVKEFLVRINTRVIIPIGVEPPPEDPSTP